MMVGGIPYYLDLFKAELSLYQNIDELFFNPGARLHGEYNDLFTSQFEKHDLSKRIVEMLASKSLGFTSKEIADSLGMKSRNKGLYDVLDALETGGFIGQYVPYTGSMRLPRYKLLDPFCLFYLKHIAQNKGKRSYWQSFGSSPKASAWRGYAFENLCFCHEAEIVKAMGIGGMRTSASLWYRKGSEQEKGSQIDLIIERADNIVNLCEMKFYSGEVRCDKESHLNLMGKMESLQSCIARKYSILNVLVTTFGLYKGAYSSDYPIVIALDDLFQ